MENQIENLDKMIFAFDGFVLNCENNFNNLQRIHKYCHELNDIEIYNISHRAFQEIKKLSFVPNNNADKLLDFYNSKTETVIDKIKFQIEKYGLNNANNAPKFVSYFETVQPLFDFYDKIIPLLNAVPPQQMQDSNLAPYNEMYAVSNLKTRFRLKNGGTESCNNKNNPYELVNTNLYDKDTNELIEIDNQNSYNTSFMLDLGKMYIPDIKPFLSYQHENSQKPNELRDYIKYCALHHTIIKHEGKKDAIKDWLTEIEKTNVLPPHIRMKSEQKPSNTLGGLITHPKSVEIVEGLKVQYKNIKGKQLKLLLLALIDLGLFPKERCNKKFHDCCINEFKWDIASYNAMNGYDYIENTDSEEFNSMKQFIETITKTN